MKLLTHSYVCGLGAVVISKFLKKMLLTFRHRPDCLGSFDEVDEVNDVSNQDNS